MTAQEFEVLAAHAEKVAELVARRVVAEARLGGMTQEDVDAKIEAAAQLAVDSLPWMRFLGAWEEGTTYRAGSMVQQAGHMWHANEETTSSPGDGNAAWTLAVRRGRDGKGA